MSDLAVPTSLLGLTTEHHGAGLVITVRGEIDLSTRQELADQLDEGVRDVLPPQPLVVDLTEVTFLGSAGLALLLDAQEATSTKDVALRVVGVHRAVRRPVEAVGLSDLLPLFTTVESALTDVPVPRTGEEILSLGVDSVTR